MRCPRLNACMILLEGGEASTDQTLAGDTGRWLIETSVMGRGQESHLIVIKPQACDIATNMLIPTTRRVYELALVSDRCNNNDADETYTRQVKFWYPEQMRADRAAQEQVLEADSVEAGAPQATPSINRNYKIDRSWFLGRKNYPWIPEEIFDDGIQTYVVLPQRAGTSKLPILYEREGGNRQVPNYALRGDTIVADHVLEHGELVVGTGDGHQEIKFENRGEAGEARKEDEEKDDGDREE